MPYIKTHSNYVLKKDHQTVADGTIWERDITTIGGVNQFSPGQIPIYRSNNFIITVRNEGKESNQYNRLKWKENESGDTWTLENISGITSEFEDQNDIKIVLKQDYYDFRDFAYYGSLSELFRSSINDIFQRFPGELYVTLSGSAYYTSSYTEDFETFTEEIKFDENSKYVSNPYGINVHSSVKPVEGNPLKYFANGGFKNYEIIQGDDEENAEKITSWSARTFVSVLKKQGVLDGTYSGDLFYDNYMRSKIDQLASQPDRELRWTDVRTDESGNCIVSGYSVDCSGVEKGYNEGWDDLLECFASGEIHQNYEKYFNTRFHVFSGGTISDDNDVSENDSTYGIKGYPSEEKAATRLNELYSAWVEAHDEWLADEPVREDGETEEAYQERVEAWEQEEPENPQLFIYSYSPCGDLSCYILTTPCKGYKMGSVFINNIKIDAWVGDNSEIVYLSNNTDIHIRPKEEFIVDFYNNCNNFEKLILARDTHPKYKSLFSVIKENEHGYYREMEEFVFPTSEGGYNVDASSYGFSKFTTRLSEIGEYYDEFFTDNLYRSMTHEAIKNFDWTYTREFYQGDEQQFVIGGERVQKALRVFAREFDEILSYINNIKNSNRITYDERSNIPNYFLTDSVESKGWDVKLVYPYELKEYMEDDSGNTITNASGNVIYVDSYVEQEQLDNKIGDNYIIRQFSQNPKKEVFPYTENLIDENIRDGYFISCDTGGTRVNDYVCEYKNSIYNLISAKDENTVKKFRLKNKIRSFTDERPYTYFDANNEFMKRLAINSPYIWRHKGTIEGIEMLLGMFGLKSQRWVDRLGDGCRESGVTADYDVTEYTSFTNRIEEEWDAVHQMYRMDWINSTKTIVYDYRSTSNYTKYGASDWTSYLSYQGLPVTYKDETVQVDSGGTVINEPYIRISPLSAQSATSNSAESFTRIDGNNAPVMRRYLYPRFSPYEQLDGNPYYQMNGGWMAKTLTNGKKVYNFQYDVDDNISYTCEVASGTATSSGTTDNHPIYKETVRNIRSVENIQKLVSTPSDKVVKNSIYYVSHIEKDIAVINNSVYKINYEYSGNESKPLMYVVLTKNGGYIKIGNDRFFDESIVVYTKTKVVEQGHEPMFGDYGLIESIIPLTDKSDGYSIKAYISYDVDGEGKKSNFDFVCKDTIGGYYTIDSFVVMDALYKQGDTNYFIIKDVNYSNRMASENDEYGWIRLNEKDSEYIRINTITNYYEGNNPHNGNMDYDSGHEYFTYYKKLFKYAIANYLFDERCYENFYDTFYSEIYDYGFEGLIDADESIKQYTPFIINDSKIHYFGNYYKKSDNNPIECTEVVQYSDNKELQWRLKTMYNFSDSRVNVTNYILNDDDNVIGGSPYSGFTSDEVDEVTNQVVNNKRISITFNLHNEWHTNQGQCEVKYLDDIVMNYLSQMIPSTAIVDIKYVYTPKD